MAQVLTFPECKGKQPHKCPGVRTAGGKFGGAVCNCACHKTQQATPQKIEADDIPPAIRKAVLNALEVKKMHDAARIQIMGLKPVKQTAEEQTADRAVINAASKVGRDFTASLDLVVAAIRAHNG